MLLTGIAFSFASVLFFFKRDWTVGHVWLPLLNTTLQQGSPYLCPCGVR